MIARWPGGGPSEQIVQILAATHSQNKSSPDITVCEVNRPIAKQDRRDSPLHKAFLSLLDGKDMPAET